MNGLNTPSLRRRVTLVVLLLVAVMLAVLVSASDVVLRSRLEGQLRQRLADRAVVADALADQVDPRDLARRLEGDGISVVLKTGSGAVYAEGPLAGAAAADAQESPVQEGPATPSPMPPGKKPPPRGAASTDQVVQSGDRLSINRRLDDGDRLLLLADARDLNATLDQVRLVLWLAALAVLVAAGVAVPLVVRRAIAPLRTFTDVAHSITAGDRSRRLHPRQPATELGRTAVAFDAMLDDVVGAERRAVDSERRLREFLSDAAHELRTPITGVHASAELLLREDPPREERERTLIGLLRESRRAGRLVDDMLLMARIDQGLALHRRPVDLRALAADVADDRTRQSAGAVSVSGPDVTIDADPDRITQVVANLVDNAIAHGEQVAIATWRDGDRVGLDVTDDGPGVPAADRERVFERLVRLEESRSRHVGGAGLGLPIARGIARAHDGDLTSEEPEDGTGARFRLSLPTVAP